MIIIFLNSFYISNKVLREAREYAESNPAPSPEGGSPTSASRGSSSYRLTFQHLWDNTTGEFFYIFFIRLSTAHLL